jgi:glycosyltransferase involved in cell wall biosynthesis
VTRVLVLSNDWPGPEGASAGNFVRDQLLALRGHGIDPVVVTYRSGFEPLPRRLARRSYWQYRRAVRAWVETDDFPVHRVLFRRPNRPDEDLVPALCDAVLAAVDPSREHFDALYAHWLWPSGAAGLRLREAYDAPLVAISRGGDLQQWLERPNVAGHVDDVVRRTDRLLANSSYLRSRGEELVPGSAARCEVVYNGVDTALLAPVADPAAVRTRLGTELDRRYLVCCGHIEERKGYHELSEAWRAIEGRFPDWTLVVIGRTIDRSLRDVVARGPRTILTGSVPHATVVDWLHVGDLYVQPSRSEGLANGTLEAVAAGLAVVTTDTSGQPEVVTTGVNGILVPVNDVAALGAALALLMGDAARRAEMGAAGRARAVASFDRRVHAARLASILHTARRS